MRSSGKCVVSLEYNERRLPHQGDRFQGEAASESVGDRSSHFIGHSNYDAGDLSYAEIP